MAMQLTLTFLVLLVFYIAIVKVTTKNPFWFDMFLGLTIFICGIGATVSGLFWIWS